MQDSSLQAGNPQHRGRDARAAGKGALLARHAQPPQPPPPPLPTHTPRSHTRAHMPVRTMMAMPLAAPRRSGNQRMSVDTGLTYPSPSPMPPVPTQTHMVAHIGADDNQNRLVQYQRGQGKPSSARAAVIQAQTRRGHNTTGQSWTELKVGRGRAPTQPSPHPHPPPMTP